MLSLKVEFDFTFFEGDLVILERHLQHIQPDQIATSIFQVRIKLPPDLQPSCLSGDWYLWQALFTL